MKHRKLTAIIAGVGANAILGFNFIFSNLIIDEVSPIVLLAYQCTICVLAMAVCIPLPIVKCNLRGRGKKLLPLLFMGVCDPLLYYIGTNYALKCNTSTTFTAVMVALMPVFALAFGAIFLREIPTALQIVFSVLSVAGVVILSLQGKNDGSVSLEGVLFLLLTVASGVGYGLISRGSAKEFGAFERTFGCFFSGMVLVDLLAVIENIGDLSALVRPLANPRFVLCVLALGILSSAVEYVAYNYSMTYLPVSQAMLFSGISTVTTAVFSVIIFPTERANFTWLTALCIVLIVAGVIGAQMFGRKEEEAKPEIPPDRQNS